MEKIYTINNVETLITNSLVKQFDFIRHIPLYDNTNSFMFHYSYAGLNILFNIDCYDAPDKLVLNDNLNLSYLPQSVIEHIHTAVKYANNNLIGRYGSNAITDNTDNPNA